MTKREFLDKVFALAPNEANAIMDAFDEYVESTEPHWISCSEGLPREDGFYLVTLEYKYGAETTVRFFKIENGEHYWSVWGNKNITAWMPKPEPYKPTVPPECEGDCGWCKPTVIEKCKGVTE